jgi:hypothetical protein
MNIARMGLGTAIMLAWGLSSTSLTLRLLRIAEEQHLVAGGFFALIYGVLATPFLNWFMFHA